MIIYIPKKIHWAHVNPLFAALMLSGVSVASFEEIDLADCVYFGKNNNYDEYMALPEKLLQNINLKLTLKDKIPEQCAAAGVNFIHSEIINNADTILNFHNDNVFIKPTEGGASQTPYTFAYKTFTSKTELLALINQECPDFFTVDEIGKSKAQGHIIQQAILPSKDGYTHQYYVPCLVNGEGIVHFEGMGKLNMRLESKNDVDDVKYPIRNMRDLILRLPSDKTDQYDIFSQIQKLVNFYSIKNTPISMNWIVDSDGQAYLIDLAYNFNRQFYMTRDLCPEEFFVDKLKYVYDNQHFVMQEWDGWIANFDLEILCDIPTVIEYAKTLGIHCTPAFVFGTSESSLVRPFTCSAPTEQACRDKLQQLKEFIDSQPTVN